MQDVYEKCTNETFQKAKIGMISYIKKMYTCTIFNKLKIYKTIFYSDVLLPSVKRAKYTLI